MKKLFISMVALMLVAGFAMTAAAANDYYIFGSQTFYGYGVDSYGDYIFAVGTDNYIHAWEVTIPAGADPNDRDYDNNGIEGDFAPRTFTSLGKIRLSGVSNLYGGGELYVSNGVMWYGSGRSGNLKAFDWSVNGASLTGARDSSKDVTVNNSVSSSETLAFDDTTNTWYCGTRDRKIYHLDNSSGKWVYDFTHLNMGGSHQDGIEFMDGSGKLWVSDMTSDHLAMYENLGTVANPNWQIFDKDNDGVRENSFDDTYNYADPANRYVEGLGFGALGHFWATSGSVLYEIGGGIIPPPPSVPEPATLLLLGTSLIGLAGFKRKIFKK